MTYYDQIAEGYEELHKEEQLKKIQIIKQFLKPKKDDKLLDVGCGTGLTTEPWPCKRYGVDPAPKLLARAKNKLSNEHEKGLEKTKSFQREEIEYKLAPAEAIPYKDNSFDYVISITAIQNFKDIEKGLKEIKRVGKDKFILTALKRSEKIEKIKELINKHFKVKEVVEEEKDLVFIV